MENERLVPLVPASSVSTEEGKINYGKQKIFGKIDRHIIAEEFACQILKH